MKMGSSFSSEIRTAVLPARLKFQDQSRGGRGEEECLENDEPQARRELIMISFDRT